jgi:protein-S-isoprenylcysteine O-methyltransferase Ste14
MPKLSKIASAFVWTGGALFVASLAACAYVFIVTWGAPRPVVGTFASLVTNVGLFLLFATHHSWFARDRVKAALTRRWVPDRLLRSTYVWTASVLLAAVVLLWQPIGGILYQASGWPRIVLALTAIAGVLLIATAVAAISALELAGIKEGGTAGGLQVRGPYRLVRHPLYLGWALAVFAAPPMTGDRLLFAALSTAYLVVAIPGEERALARAFGDEYTRYQQVVKWRMIPFIY